jgi:hypothetical protein
VILTAHQPVYLPWLGLFHKIALADAFVSFNRVQYQTYDWNHRNKIRRKGTNDTILLSVPVHSKGHLDKKINAIEINNALPWRRKHWESIRHNYHAAPYFSLYADFLEETYRREWQRLGELNEHLLRGFLEMLGIRVRFLSAGDFDFQGTKSDLVLDMCKQFGASVFIFGALGADYARVEDFRQAGIGTVFQDYQHPQYRQQGAGFVSHLSVLDLLFNCGPASLDVLMSGNVTRAEVETLQR